MRVYGPTVLRVSLAVVFITHGIEKLFGAWGGSLGETMQILSRLHLPAAYPLAVAAAAGELACGILLLVGGFTLWATAALLAARAAVFYQVYSAGRTVVPSAPAARTEFELSLLLIGALLALLLMGPGALSLDERRSHSISRAAAGRGRVRPGRM